MGERRTLTTKKGDKRRQDVMTKVRLGTVIHGTLRTEHLILAFLEELEAIDRDRADSFWERIPAEAFEDLENEWWSSEEAYWMVEELFDVLNEFAPPYCYFGALEGDGSDFGFWIDRYAFEEAVENGEILRVSELPDNAPEGYEYIAVVTDHGNVTLYHRNAHGELEEVWSVV